MEGSLGGPLEEPRESPLEKPLARSLLRSHLRSEEALAGLPKELSKSPLEEPSELAAHVPHKICDANEDAPVDMTVKDRFVS